MVELSDQQRQALVQAGTPLEVADSTGSKVYYLISAEEYQRLRTLLEKPENIDPSYFEFTDFRPAG
jgi:hypothetical protein